MSNYYHRDKDGNWFVKHGGILTPVEFSASMECAYFMGAIDLLEKQRSELNETVMQIRDSHIRGVEDSSI